MLIWEPVPVPVLRLPDIHPLLDAEYTPYDVGIMGELDVRILTELFGGQEIATAPDASVEWRPVLCGAAEVGGYGGGEGVYGFAGTAVLLAVEERRFGTVVYAGLCGAVGAEVLACGATAEG